jgi:CzcA family heavy metal efflux pump
MTRWIVGSSITYRLLVVAAAAAAIVVGASQLRDMPVDVLPEFTPPTVEIQTEALGLSAAEVAELITVPMEQDLLIGVAFLDDIRSESLPGLSRIFLTFEPGTDIYRARQVVAERLTQAHALPNVSKPPQMLQPLSSTNRVMIIGASSKALTPIEMGVLARWTIAPRLVGVQGVANVSVWGFRDRQLQIQVDPEKLRDQDVSLVQVIETAGNSLWFSPLTFVEASTPGTGGFIDTPNQRLGVQHLSPLSSAADLAKVRVQDTGTESLVLGDVAKVVEDHQPLIGGANAVGGAGDLLFVVEKLPEANTLEVTRRLESAIGALQPGLAGVDFDTTVYRPASFIDKAIDNLRWVLLLGAALIALVVAAFFFRWRTALVALVAIPLSLITAVLVLWGLGTNMNAIVLAGFAAALLIVVDDAVAGVDNVARRLRERDERGDTRSTAAVIVDATLEARSVTFYATLFIALSVVPLFYFEELAGAFFPDVAGAYLLALLTSMVVALTVTPALLALLFAKAPPDRGDSPVARRLQSSYQAGLSRIVTKPRVAYAAVGIVLVAAGISIPFLGVSLLPTLKEQQVLVRWDGPPGTSLPEMNRVTALATRELEALPGVEDVGAHVGRAVASDLSVNANTSELWVTIDSSADYDATVASIRDVVRGYPGLSQETGSYSNQRAGEILAGGSDRDIVVRVYGEDTDVLATQADKVRGIVAGVEGTAGVGVLHPPVEPTVEVEVDLASAQRLGIKPGDVRRAAATMLGGLVVGNLFEQQKVFEVVVWGTPETRSSLSSIRRMLIDTPDGRHVRLGDVADVRIAPNATVIQRQAVSRYLDVVADVSGRGRGTVVADIESRLAETSFPLEYHAEILAAGGQPVGRLIALALACAVGMFLLLQACFGSWRLATLSFLTLPVALTGGLLAALIAGGTLSFGSFMGLFALLGLAARNGTALFDRMRRLEQHEGESFGEAMVVRGARDRLVPVTMTAVAGALVFLPIVIAGSGPGFELLHPLAVVLLGGLVTTTLLNLVVVPVLYLRFGFSRAAEALDPLVDVGFSGARRDDVPGGVVVTQTRATRPGGGS